jgi:hypothetical protein
MLLDTVVELTRRRDKPNIWNGGGDRPNNRDRLVKQKLVLGRFQLRLKLERRQLKGRKAKNPRGPQTVRKAHSPNARDESLPTG